MRGIVYQVNREHVLKLKEKRKWSMTRLAQAFEVSKAMIVLWLNGKRNGTGMKLIMGALKAFPNEPREKLIIPVAI